jgi:hypothetical protein
MKDKAIVCFRRLPDGKVIGDIIDDVGVVVKSKDFGLMSVEEFERIFDLVNKEAPKLKGKILPTIELTRN